MATCPGKATFALTTEDALTLLESPDKGMKSEHAPPRRKHPTH